MIESSKHTVIHTGAGISTSAGIPDFRGPTGVWTLEQKGKKPTINISFDAALPTKTHMAIKTLVANGSVQYIVSQNIDGLHLKSGLSRKNLSELHGNMFIEQCNKCRRQFVRNSPAPTVGKKMTGGICKGGKKARPCRGGQLIDNILDWEHDLPDDDLDLAFMHSTLADLNICLGTTLQIVPSGNLPLKNKKFGGQLVICNLQPTKHDKKADLVISTYVDDILMKVMKRLGLEIDEYSTEDDPTKQIMFDGWEWTIQPENLKEVEKSYDSRVKIYNAKKRKSLSTVVKEEDDDTLSVANKKPSIKKELKKEENVVDINKEHHR